MHYSPINWQIVICLVPLAKTLNSWLKCPEYVQMIVINNLNLMMPFGLNQINNKTQTDAESENTKV